ncbi:glycoside hydrolase family 18 protein [Mycena filopes]|nr:glycoside hydrolase family 18 protein [Mycena filopes]
MLFPRLALLSTLFHGLVLAKVKSPKIATAWYAGWHANSDPAFSLSDVPWAKYTELTYAFAETTPDVRAVSLNGSDPEELPKFVAAAHAHGVKAKVSIGGWTGSLFWSSNVATPRNRTLFVKTLVDFAKKYKLDGLDFDWEYPGSQGIGCNAINDPLGSKLILSAATAISPFADSDGNPSVDVSAFSKVLDYIAIMVYDINGPWSAAVGPNAPFKDAPGAAVSAVSDWHAAGMPLDQIVLGVASYGHSFSVAKSDAFNGTQLALYPAFNCGGVINFWGLIQQGYLNADGSPKSGVPYVFDECTQTPYVYNETTEVMISFDNAQSFAVKGEYIKSKGLRGFSMWEAGGDSNSILVNAIRKSGDFSSFITRPRPVVNRN